MDQSPRLSLSYVAPAQAQKHVTVNETFRRLDALCQLTVRSRTTAAAPGDPAEGEAYILPASPSGAWAEFSEAAIAAFQDGAWARIAPALGYRAYVEDEAALVAFDGAAWTGVAGAAADGAAQFGINAEADATNRLSVQSDAVLFSHDGATPGSGDARVSVNKAAAANTASHLFQTNFSARAEFGLTGDDDFHLKVSPDGATFHDAIIVDKNTGRVGVGGAPLRAFHVMGDTVDLFELTAHEDNLPGVGINFQRGRGSLAAPSALLAGDTIGVVRGLAYDGADYQTVTNIRAKVEGIAGAAIGSRIEIMVKDPAGASVDAIVVSGADGVLFNLPARLKSYAVATAPSAAAAGAGAVIFITDETGGAVPAFSDGAAWRRMTDRAAIS